MSVAPLGASQESYIAASKIIGVSDFEELMRGVVEINEGSGLLSAKRN